MSVTRAHNILPYLKVLNIAKEVVTSKSTRRKMYRISVNFYASKLSAKNFSNDTKLSFSSWDLGAHGESDSNVDFF